MSMRLEIFYKIHQLRLRDFIQMTNGFYSDIITINQKRSAGNAVFVVQQFWPNNQKQVFINYGQITIIFF